MVDCRPYLGRNLRSVGSVDQLYTIITDIFNINIHYFYAATDHSEKPPLSCLILQKKIKHSLDINRKLFVHDFFFTFFFVSHPVTHIFKQG